ncbi:MAG: hypothetical protein VXW29_19630, partial [SAR324 cluster bacterium]|nr:hypothetical protein [SAR324 cluster bacterium]
PKTIRIKKYCSRYFILESQNISSLPSLSAQQATNLNLLNMQDLSYQLSFRGLSDFTRALRQSGAMSW